MVTVFSPVWKITPEEFRRVTEVTYLGYVHGTMAALRHMMHAIAEPSFRSARRSPTGASRCKQPIAAPSMPYAASLMPCGQS
jgi:NAD(P)-dependent dehydrogenase (short-subunit alcohol dehydrogenase family)